MKIKTYLITFLCAACFVSCKEAAQKIVGKGAKEASEAIIKKGVKEGASQAIQEGGEKAARELAQEGAERGVRELAQEGAEKLAGKTLKELAASDKLYKNLYDDFATKISKEFADGITTTSTKDGIELVSKDFPVSKISINKNLVVGNAGSLKNAGPVNEFFNHLMPNKTYMIDNGLFVYKTDDLGRVVEYLDSETLEEECAHPYTKALLGSILDVYCDQNDDIAKLSGEPVSPIGIQVGCPFASRCPNCTEKCKKEIPSLSPVNAEHKLACFNPMR